MRTLFLLLFIATISASSNVSAKFSNSEIQQAYYKSYNYEKIGIYKDAIDTLLPLYKQYSKGYTLNLRIAYLYYLDKKYANAAHYYNAAIKIAPNALDAKLGQLLLLIAQQQYSKCSDLAYQVIKVDYYNYYGNLRLAYCLREQKKYDIALQIILKMLGIYPLDVSLLNEYALIKFTLKEYTLAGQTFNNVLTLAPENVIAKESLAAIAAQVAPQNTRSK
jgi:tetratricopeptide (TPR) repeat protein